MSLSQNFKNTEDAIKYFKLHQKDLINIECDGNHKLPTCLNESHINEIGYPSFGLFDPEFEVKYMNYEHNFAEKSFYTFNTTNIDDFVKMISSPDDHTRIYEIYPTTIKMFMDIDKIPHDKPELIKTIINEFIEFVKDKYSVSLNKYIVTINKASHHKDITLSYHVIFPEYAGTVFTVKSYVSNFVDHFRDYHDYVDGAVYNPRRLFRSINQNSASPLGTEDINDQHILHYTHGYPENVENTEIIKDTVIQYVKGCNYLKEIKSPKGYKLANSSALFEKDRKLRGYYKYSSSVYQNMLMQCCKASSKNDKEYINSLSNEDFRKYIVENINNLTDNQLQSIRNALNGKLKKNSKYNVEVDNNTLTIRYNRSAEKKENHEEKKQKHEKSEESSEEFTW